MKREKRLLLLILAVCMLLCACGAPGAESQETTGPASVPTEPAVTEPAATEPPIQEPVLPEMDAATGTLMFYFGDYRIHAGAPMADVIAMGISTDQDLDAVLQPYHTSEVITVRVDLEDSEQDDDPLIFVVAVNAQEEPLPVSQCQIYSITVNTESGIKFGSGNETEPFVTGKSTRKEIEAIYGEPGFSRSGESKYVEVAYYQPFNSVYFSYKSGVVRQIIACYSANLYRPLAEAFTGDLTGMYYGADCAILMSQYLDVKPYLDGSAEVEKLESLEESIVMDGQTIELGISAADLPTPFGEPFRGHLLPVAYKYYVRTGRENEEEFYMLNWNGQNSENHADSLVVKGVITENREYCSWGKDNSAFHEFEYMGLTNQTTIDQVLETLGMPLELHCESSGRLCDAWLYYEDVNGNELLLRVDPMLNQLMELHVSKYYSGAMMFR